MGDGRRTTGDGTEDSLTTDYRRLRADNAVDCVMSGERVLLPRVLSPLPFVHAPYPSPPDRYHRPLRFGARGDRRPPRAGRLSGGARLRAGAAGISTVLASRLA